jgi:hypothetical protein
MSPKLDSSGIVMPSASQPLTTWTVIQPAQLASFEFHMSLETLWSKKNTCPANLQAPQLKSTYPPVIKHGNGKSHVNEGL